MALKELSPKKTQVSLVLLEQGMRRLQDNVKNINNEEYLGDIDLRTLLTTLVENLHAVSHLKNETFTALVCPRLWHDFKGIFKKNNEVGCQIFHTREIVLSGSKIQYGIGRCKRDETSSSC